MPLECDPGYIEVNGTCEPCPKGTYLMENRQVNGLVCQPCDDDNDKATTVDVASTHWKQCCEFSVFKPCPSEITFCKFS